MCAFGVCLSILKRWHSACPISYVRLWQSSPAARHERLCACRRKREKGTNVLCMHGRASSAPCSVQMRLNPFVASNCNSAISSIVIHFLAFLILFLCLSVSICLSLSVALCLSLSHITLSLFSSLSVCLLLCLFSV